VAGCGLLRVRPAGPDLRIEQAEHGFVGGVHRDHRVQEKAEPFAVATAAEAFAPAVAAAEVDLRGVLHGDDPPPGAARCGARGEALQDLRRGHLRRAQEPMHTHFTGAIFADPADRQRAGGDDALKDQGAALGPPRIAEPADRFPLTHDPLSRLVLPKQGESCRADLRQDFCECRSRTRAERDSDSAALRLTRDDGRRLTVSTRFRRYHWDPPG
jgi:hypothetical protein